MGKKITVTIKDVTRDNFEDFERLFVSKFGGTFPTNVQGIFIEKIKTVPESKFPTVTVSGRRVGKTAKAANFPTVTIDSLTKLQKHMLEHMKLMEEEEKKKKNKKRKP